MMVYFFRIGFIFIFSIGAGIVQSYDHDEHDHHRHLVVGRDDNNSNNKRSIKPRCGTKKPSLAQMQETEQIVAEYLARKAESESRSDNGAADGPATIIVPVCFHSINKRYSDSVLQKQLDALNKAHTNSSCCDTSQGWCKSGTCSVNTGVRFEMAVVGGGPLNNKITGATTAKVSNQNACKKTHWLPLIRNIAPDTIVDQYVTRRIRMGGRNILNLVFAKILDAYGPAGREYDLYGFATFPEDVKSDPDLDVVYINPIAMVGGSDDYTNEGDTLVHEVGHWLGLYHTFENGCNPPGDLVADTPYESDASFECPIGQKSCSNSNGTDPIHNFMDYTSDKCIYAFTKGQADRIQAMWTAYRT